MIVTYLSAHVQQPDQVQRRDISTVLQGEVVRVLREPFELLWSEKLLFGRARSASRCLGLIQRAFEYCTKLIQNIAVNCAIFDKFRLKKP